MKGDLNRKKFDKSVVIDIVKKNARISCRRNCLLQDKRTMTQKAKGNETLRIIKGNNVKKLQYSLGINYDGSICTNLKNFY